jgi:hypothetical protein
VVKALRSLVEDATAGDPVSGLRWTYRSLRKLARALQEQGHAISAVTVGRLLKDAGYSLRTNRKRLARNQEPERDRQFRYIARLRRRFRKHGNPAISVDTKKKEVVGLFKNAGRTWRRQGQDVYDHDFPSWGIGKAIPFGIYDGQRNTGFVVVGTSRESPAFVGAAVSAWWEQHGCWCYPRSRHWLISADCGGGNNPRCWAWRWALQQLADRWGVAITVAHYPPGASKWNPIEHRLFSAISANWQGEPLKSYETMLNYIRTTTTQTGLRCRAMLDTTEYPKAATISEDEKRTIRIRRTNVLPHWNYTILPRSKRPSCF